MEALDLCFKRDFNKKLEVEDIEEKATVKEETVAAEAQKENPKESTSFEIESNVSTNHETDSGFDCIDVYSEFGDLYERGKGEEK